VNNWQIYSLQDVAEFKTGKLNSNAANENGEYPFFTCSPETLKINEYAFDCEALLLAGNNAEGNFALKYYNGKFNAYQRTYVITVHDPKRITYKFLFYNLKTQLKELQNISAGSATKFLTMSIINEIELKLPPLEEQKAIASVLSSLDDKIDLLHRQNTTLEAMAETLFRQWFVEEAQEDWEDVQITKLFDVRDGTHDSPKQKTTGKPLITSKHINGNRLDFESAYLISDDDFDKINQRSKVDKHDILISMIGTIGLIYLEQSDEVNYAIKNVGLFKTSQNQNWRAYTYFWLKSNVGKQFLDEHVSGSTQEYVSLGSFRSIAFKKPPIENLDEFNKIANGYLNKIKNNSAQIQTLEKLRENLLPKLMSGEVRVDQQYE
jgi:type I restriction enzyme S subunit